MSHSNGLPKYPNEILSSPVFHPEISNRLQAERYVLTQKQGAGSFIVRPNSENNPSCVSITTCISKDQVCNAKVLIEQSRGGEYQYFISEKLKFPSFQDLLMHYKSHKIYCKQDFDNLYLKIPLNRARGRTSSENSYGQGAAALPIGGPIKTTPHPRLDPNNKPKSFDCLPAARIEPGLRRNQSEKKPGTSSSNSHPVLRNHKRMMQCRPPAPLPRPATQCLDDSVYYSRVDRDTDFFQEIYKYLKETEMCECGLAVCDSQLALGWTIHRSQDPATLNHIFFQLEEKTTWDMPAELVPHLSKRQLGLILTLCKEGHQPLPVCLRARLDDIFEKRHDHH